MNNIQIIVGGNIPAANTELTLELILDILQLKKKLKSRRRGPCDSICKTMVRDRLKEFQELGRSHNGHVVETNSDRNDSDKKPANCAALFEVLDTVGVLYRKLMTLQTEAEIVAKECNGKLHEPDKLNHMEDVVAKVKIEAFKVKTALDQIKRKSEESDSDIARHIAKTHHVALAIHMNTLLHDLSMLQSNAHEQHARFIHKELLITGQAMNDEELDDLMDRNAELFTQDLLRNTQITRQQLRDMQTRQEAVLQLEKSIGTLALMFKEISMMVHEQGESVDRIESNVFSAQAMTESGREQLMKAKDLATKARKRKIIIGIVVTVLVVIIVLAIVLSVI